MHIAAMHDNKDTLNKDDLGLLKQFQVKKDPKAKMHFVFSVNYISILNMGAVAYSLTPVDLVCWKIRKDKLP